MDIKADIKISEEYSPKKKKTNILAPCSVINPATNSDSASGKSKGGLFVSAKIAIKNIKAIGNKGKIFHTACWHSTIYVKLKEPENIINIKIIEENTNSYESN